MYFDSNRQRTTKTILLFWPKTDKTFTTSTDLQLTKTKLLDTKNNIKAVDWEGGEDHLRFTPLTKYLKINIYVKTGTP